MITVNSTNPQIILLALAILIGAIAALFYGISEYRRTAVVYHSFKRVLQRTYSSEQHENFIEALELEMIRALRQVHQALDQQSSAERKAFDKMLRVSADALERTSTRFDRPRFIKACTAEQAGAQTSS